MGLTPEQIELLLKTPQTSTRSPRTKADTTEDRQINNWFKQNHHVCTSDCEHRTQSPTGKACWNVDCVDPRPDTHRGTSIVALVKEQYICRYCFLSGYLKTPTVV